MLNTVRLILNRVLKGHPPCANTILKCWYVGVDTDLRTCAAEMPPGPAPITTTSTSRFRTYLSPAASALVQVGSVSVVVTGGAVLAGSVSVVVTGGAVLVLVLNPTNANANKMPYVMVSGGNTCMQK